LLDGFYEWQWLDPKGKAKQQYLITRKDGEPFALAGLWSQWVNPAGSTVNSYTIITTEARGIMREIHNSKLRMPVILQPDCERDWLAGNTTAKLFTDLVGIRIG
jgi:putative SOS response-associated peptidase YedK